MCIDRPETKRERHKEMEEVESERERKCPKVSHLGTGCNVSRPGGHHSQALSRVLFKAKQISGPECHRKDTQASSPPISVQDFKSPFLLPSSTNLSSSFLHPASHPHSTPTTTLRGGTVQQIYDPPISHPAQFIDISCQLSF